MSLCFAWFLLLACLAPLWAQVDITLVDTNPPGVRLFNTGQFTLVYDLQGTTNGVEVNFFRDDGQGQVTIVIPDPANPPPPFPVVLPLKTGVDRVANSFTAVARDLVTNGIDLAGPFTVFSDDIGPDAPVLSAPIFPVTTFTDTLRVVGRVDNLAAGGATLPETSGQIIIQRASDLLVLGGGQITTNSSFIGLIDLAPLPIGVATDIAIFGVDSVGNIGTTLTVQVTRLQPTAPVVTATIQPIDGALTRNPGVTITGSITGDVPPLAVNIFIDGLLESQITGLNPGQEFIHTVNLPSEGGHSISIQGVNSAVPPNQGQATFLGQVTLDRTAPQAPVILRPDPSLGTLVTNASTILIEGFTSERDPITTDSLIPGIELQGPSGVTFAPPAPLPIDPVTGRFQTEANISALPDGTYSVDVAVVDSVGNSDTGSLTRVSFTKDTVGPNVDRVLVNQILAPAIDPEIYVGLISVPIEVTFSEPMVTFPDLTVTQEGGNPTPTGVSGTTTRSITFVHGVVTGFDGPVQMTLAGGTDGAGNGMTADLTRFFIVDTTPPQVLLVDPADRTRISSSPARIRIRLEDPPSSAGTFSGVNLLNSIVTLTGPLESAGSLVPVTATPFDPFTLDVVPVSPLTAEGTYRLSVIPEDKVGNRAIAFQSTFILDTSALIISDRNVVSNPPRGACVTAATIPGGGTPFVELTVEDPQFNPAGSKLVVRDYCRVPPEVPGVVEVVDADTLRFLFDRPFASDGSDDGIYAVQLDAVDMVGNASPTFTTTFVMDNLAPSVAQTFPLSNTAINGPLRIVDATLLDARRDFCRRPGGISRDQSKLTLTLLEPNVRVNQNAAGTQIPGTLRFLSIGDVDKILLEIADSRGFPSGLRSDGGDDGVYSMSIEAFDCATNTSGTIITSFTYDTIRPVLVVKDLIDNGVISGPDFIVQGTLGDNLGGSGVDRVTLTLEGLDRDGNVTTSPIFLDELATLDPPPLGATQPVQDWTFTGDLRRVALASRARLRVRGFDKAGNFDELLFTVTAQESTILPPLQSQPRSGDATSSLLLNFSWEAQTQASRFRVRIQTPNGDTIEKETTDNSQSLDVNLTGIPDPEGRFLWAVASIDALGGVGAFSPNRPFFVDRGRPKVVAIDILDPSPEAVGSINEGLVRVTVRFSEAMDTTVSPQVTIQLANTAIAPLTVTQLEYNGNTWQGEAVIPEASEVAPDPNGIAQIRVREARDLGGNVNLEPQGGITLFEVDTGPFWRVAVFLNPVDDQDVVLLVKGFQRDGGQGDEIVGTPSLFVLRQGQANQTPVLQRINQSSFRGTFRLDRRSTKAVSLRVTGQDRNGNASTRTITLDVQRLRPENTLQIQASGLRVAFPRGVVRRDTMITTLAATTSVQPTIESSELELVQALPQVGPLGLALQGRAMVRVPAEDLPEDRSDLGIFRRDGSSMVYLPGLLDDQGVRALTEKLAPFYLMRDRTPPTLGAPRVTWSSGRLRVEIPAQDGGAGVSAQGSLMKVGGREVPLEFDPDTGVLYGEMQGRGLQAGDPVEVEARDKIGNTAVSALAAVPASGFVLKELTAYPNPARIRSSIRYRLTGAAEMVLIEVFDGAGHRVQRLRGPTGPGVQSVTWDLTSRRGRRVRNGVYIARVTARNGGQTSRQTLKIAVLR
jgi:hypothetical protein